MRILLICLVVGVACPARGEPPREVFVTPWFAYGMAASHADPVKEVGGAPVPRGDRPSQHMSGGVEILVPVGRRWGVLGSVDRSVVGEYGGRREAAVTSASVGFLALTDRKGRVCWDQGFSLGLMWPDPWGPRAVNAMGRWRLASAVQVHRFAAVELAAGFQVDSGDFRRLRGLFGRVGLRLGPRRG